MSAAEEYRRRLGQHSDIRGHLEFLHETALAYPEPVIIELGVAWGNSTSALLSAAGEAGGALWSVDAGEVPRHAHDPRRLAGRPALEVPEGR